MLGVQRISDESGDGDNLLGEPRQTEEICDMATLINSAIKELSNHHLIRSSSDQNKDLTVLTLGMAGHKGSMDIDVIEHIFNDLKLSLTCGLILDTYFHLLSVVIPYHNVMEIDVNWSIFYNEVSTLLHLKKSAK